MSLQHTPINTSQVMDHGNGSFSAEASELGWRFWPSTLITQKGKVLKKGFASHDLAIYTYNGKNCLTVFND